MEEKKIILPMEVAPAKIKNPRNLIIFSKPKCGKTSALAQLPDSLIIDLENGSDYVSGRILKANSVEDIREIGKAIEEAGKPYKYIIIDTVTRMEELCIPYAELLYSKTLPGKNWFTKGKLEYGSILVLPNGAGYPFLWNAFEKVLGYIRTLSDNVILSGHVKDKMINKAGAEFSSLDLDLTGKVARIAASGSDTIGYLYRGKGTKNYISFITSDDVACGSRSIHLRNKDILISELIDVGTENEKLVTYWDKIFIE
jgi:hypothetical protein